MKDSKGEKSGGQRGRLAEIATAAKPEAQMGLLPERGGGYAGKPYIVRDKGLPEGVEAYSDENTGVGGKVPRTIKRDFFLSPCSLPFPTPLKTQIWPPPQATEGVCSSTRLGGGNLTPDQMSLLRGRRYNRAKKAQGGDHKSKDQNDTLINQLDRLAKEHGQEFYPGAGPYRVAPPPQGPGKLWGETPGRGVNPGGRTLAGLGGS